MKDVGTKTSNALGLYDMNGNVWEWSFDWFTEGAVVEGTERISRGGSFINNENNARVGFFHRFSPDVNYTYIGFRLARTP